MMIIPLDCIACIINFLSTDEEFYNLILLCNKSKISVIKYLFKKKIIQNRLNFACSLKIKPLINSLINEYESCLGRMVKLNYNNKRNGLNISDSYEDQKSRYIGIDYFLIKINQLYIFGHQEIRMNLSKNNLYSDYLTRFPEKFYFSYEMSKIFYTNEMSHALIYKNYEYFDKLFKSAGEYHLMQNAWSHNNSADKFMIDISRIKSPDDLDTWQWLHNHMIDYHKNIEEWRSPSGASFSKLVKLACVTKKWHVIQWIIDEKIKFNTEHIEICWFLKCPDNIAIQLFNILVENANDDEIEKLIFPCDTQYFSHKYSLLFLIGINGDANFINHCLEYIKRFKKIDMLSLYCGLVSGCNISDLVVDSDLQINSKLMFMNANMNFIRWYVETKNWNCDKYAFENAIQNCTDLEIVKYLYKDDLKIYIPQIKFCRSVRVAEWLIGHGWKPTLNNVIGEFRDRETSFNYPNELYLMMKWCRDKFDIGFETEHWCNVIPNIDELMINLRKCGNLCGGDIWSFNIE